MRRVHQFLLRIVENCSFLAFWFLLGALCIWEVLAWPVYLLCAQDLGHLDVPTAGHALWAEVGGGIIFVTSGETAGQHKKNCQIS